MAGFRGKGTETGFKVSEGDLQCREVSWLLAGAEGRAGGKRGRAQACPRAEVGRGNLAWYPRASWGFVLVTAPPLCTVTAPSLTIPLRIHPGTFSCRIDPEDLSFENKQNVDVSINTRSTRLHAALQCGQRVSGEVTGVENPLPRWALRYRSHDGGTCLGHCLPHLHFPMPPPERQGQLRPIPRPQGRGQAPRASLSFRRGAGWSRGPGKRVVMGLDDGNVCPQLALVTGRGGFDRKIWSVSEPARRLRNPWHQMGRPVFAGCLAPDSAALSWDERDLQGWLPGSDVWSFSLRIGQPCVC